MSIFLLILIYASFVALGMQATIFGAVWPVMHPDFGLDMSRAGLITLFITLGVFTLCLVTEKINNKLGYGKSNLLGILVMTIAQFGIANSKSFVPLCIFSFIAGAGTGIVEIGLNNYVAFYYKPRHMSWLHALWGIGALSGPLIASFAISKNNWRYAYLIPAFIQIGFIIILIFTLSLWPKHIEKSKKTVTISNTGTVKEERKFNITFIHILPAILAFFFYKSLQSTTNYWGSSYLVSMQAIDPAAAARWVSLYFTGSMISRLLVGFLTIKFTYRQLTFLTQAINLIGVLMILLPLGKTALMLSFFIMGIGTGSFFPSMIHDTPYFFGADKAQRINSLEISAANFGGMIIPPLLGWLSKKLSMSIFPILIMIYAIGSFAFYIVLNIQAKKRHANYNA